MTVSTSINSVVYQGNGATTQFAVPFKVLSVDHLRVRRRVFATGEFVYTYVGTDFGYVGLGDSEGTLTIAGQALADTYELVIERIVSYTQDLDIINTGGFYPDTVERQFDLIAMGLQQLADLANRASVVPVGEVGMELTKVEDRANKFFAFDADGNFIASTGTGTDGGLRADLALSTGAGLIKTSSGVIAQDMFDMMNRDIARTAFANPPGSTGGSYEDVMPTGANPVAAVRYGAAGEFILIRVLHDGIIEETVLRDPAGYNGVAGGWEIFAERSLVNNQLRTWLVQPDNDLVMTTTDFAWRIGKMTVPYESAGDGPDWAYRGFGHGGMVNVPNDNQITLDTMVGVNLQLIANWPVDTPVFGGLLTIQTIFFLTYFGTATQAAKLTLARQFTPNNGFGGVGMIEVAQVEKLDADLGFQDSYVTMPAVNAFSYADRVKLAGEATVVSLVGDNVQKGNWNATVSTEFQFYSSKDPTVIRRTTLPLGQPLRKVGGGLAAWALNRSSRVHVTDDDDFAKLRVAAASSELDPPRTAWAHPTGTVYEWTNFRNTIVRAGGPI